MRVVFRTEAGLAPPRPVAQRHRILEWWTVTLARTSLYSDSSGEAAENARRNYFTDIYKGHLLWCLRVLH